MSTLYLVEQGAKLKKESKKIVIEKEGKVLLELPDFKLEKIFIFGNIQISTQAMKFLLISGIDTSFFNINGKFMGKLMPVESKNIFLRIAQYKKYNSDEFRVGISKKFIEGKINNARNFLQKYQRNHPEVDFTKSIDNLKENLYEIERKNSLNSLRGLEGRSAAIYFECFSKMILKNFEFDKRLPRPAKDPVNSLLSFGYSILASEIFSILSASGLDPYLGFLHSIEYGRPALALDLMEEFRQAIIDRLVIEIINKEIIKGDGFKEEEGQVLLKEESIRLFLDQYERRIRTIINYEDKEKNYREIIYEQIKKFSKMLMDDEIYKPFELR